MTDKEAIEIPAEDGLWFKILTNHKYQITRAAWLHFIQAHGHECDWEAVIDVIGEGVAGMTEELGYRLPPGPEQDKVEEITKLLKATWIAGNLIKRDATKEVPTESLTDVARTICALFPAPELKVLSEKNEKI